MIGLEAMEAARPPAEKELRFVVITELGGAATVRCFRNPTDAEGIFLRFTARERVDLVEALSAHGPHFIARDDAADAQMKLDFAPAGDPLPADLERRPANRKGR